MSLSKAHYTSSPLPENVSNNRSTTNSPHSEIDLIPKEIEMSKFVHEKVVVRTTSFTPANVSDSVYDALEKRRVY